MDRELDAAAEKLRVMENTHLYKLYFKGLISNELAVNGIKAGFRVVICDHKDNIVYKTKVHSKENMTSIEAEIRALLRGLDETLSLRINHISIFSDCYQIFNYVMSIYDDFKMSVL